MLEYIYILCLSISTITSSLCLNSVTNHDIQKINSAYVIESSYEELEQMFQEDNFSNYKKQFKQNLNIEGHLNHEELKTLSENYKYIKFIDVHSIQDINVILCAIIQLDKDNRVTYLYPYTISLDNSWKAVEMPYDIIELTYSTEIMVCSMGTLKKLGELMKT